MKNINLMGVLFLFFSACAGVPVLACEPYFGEVLATAQGYKVASNIACMAYVVDVPESISVHGGSGTAILSIGQTQFCYRAGKLVGTSESFCEDPLYLPISAAVLEPGEAVFFEVRDGSASVLIDGHEIGRR